jgi:hypothetical protein
MITKHLYELVNVFEYCFDNILFFVKMLDETKLNIQSRIYMNYYMCSESTLSPHVLHKHNTIYKVMDDISKHNNN